MLVMQQMLVRLAMRFYNLSKNMIDPPTVVVVKSDVSLRSINDIGIQYNVTSNINYENLLKKSVVAKF